MNDTTAAVAKAAADTGGTLPPYSGPQVVCAKCSHVGAFTEHHAAGTPGRTLGSDTRWGRVASLPERLERRCERCDFAWDEALCPPGCGMTVEALAHAIHNATPYPIELDREVRTFMARYLLECLHVTARPEHALWQYDDGRPPAGICEEPHPTAEEEDACERRRAPRPETPAADSTEEGPTP